MSIKVKHYNGQHSISLRNSMISQSTQDTHQLFINCLNPKDFKIGYHGKVISRCPINLMQKQETITTKKLGKSDIFPQKKHESTTNLARKVRKQLQNFDNSPQQIAIQKHFPFTDCNIVKKTMEFQNHDQAVQERYDQQILSTEQQYYCQDSGRQEFDEWDSESEGIYTDSIQPNIRIKYDNDENFEDYYEDFDFF